MWKRASSDARFVILAPDYFPGVRYANHQYVLRHHHSYAVYGYAAASFAASSCGVPRAAGGVTIPDGELLEGMLPAKKLRLVQAWIDIHEEELMADWALAVNGEPVFPIDPLR